MVIDGCFLKSTMSGKGGGGYCKMMTIKEHAENRYYYYFISGQNLTPKTNPQSAKQL